MTDFDARTEATYALSNDDLLRSIFGDRFYQFGSMEEGAKKPFIVLKFDRETPRRSWRTGPTDVPIQIWVHDTPGDYERIDMVIRRIRAIYALLPNKVGFFESRYFSTSVDLQDPELGTIVKVATFQWTLS